MTDRFFPPVMLGSLFAGATVVHRVMAPDLTVPAALNLEEDEKLLRDKSKQH